MADDPALLTQNEINVFNSFFPESEVPLHMGLHCDISINGKVTNSATIAVSPHLILAFKSKGAQKNSLLKTFYISDIKHLYQLPDSVRVKFDKDNLQVEIYNSTAAAVLFTQVLYRNYTLFYYKLGSKYELEVSTKEVEKFPEIKLDISPSQRFQFYFSAQCAKYQVDYRHDVCRYMHNLIITNNPIFDFSQIPTNALIGSNSILIPLIKSLQITKYIRGICWENHSCPDLLNQLSPLFGNEEKTGGLRMVHLVNCDLSGDFSKVVKCVDNSSEKLACFVSYWNLNNNPKLNFENFSRMIDLTLSKIYFISISNCNIDEKTAREIFLALSHNPNSFEIKHLEIGGVSLVGKSIIALEKFLKALNSRHTNKINLLDISSCDNLTAVLELISKELPDLEILNVSHNKFSGDDFLLLTNYISHSKKLNNIDLSKTKLSAEKIADIIKTFSKNENLQNVTMKLNDLKLSSENLLPLFRAFLSQKESCDTKWHSFHLNSNGIDREDLISLTSLFKKFPNLKTLTFSYNFDLNNEENKNIGDAIAKLLSIPSLKNLSLAGDANHQLGQELIQFLQAKNNNLEKIDISGNNISDNGFAETIKLIKRSEKLECISFCNNGIKNKNALNDLLSALKSSKNCPIVKYDIKKNEKNSKNSKNDKSEVSPESLIEDQKQVEISEMFMRNRRKEGQVLDLPFNYGDQLANDFANELSDEFEKSFENDKRFTHSCICMKIHLPLPFQRTTETTNGIRKEIDIGKMAVYQTDTMNYVVTEQCPQGVKNDKVEEVKKTKKDDNSDDENKKKKTNKNKNSDESDEEENKKKKKKTNKNSDDDDDDEKKKKKKKTNKNSDESDEEENKKKKKKINKNSDEDSDEDSEEENKKKKKKKTSKSKNSDSDEDSDEPENKKKKKKKNVQSDDDDSDEESRRKETKKKKPKKISVPISSDDSDDESENDDDIEYKLQTVVPSNSKKKQTNNKNTKRKNIQSDSESESEPSNKNRYNQNHNRKTVQKKKRFNTESESYDDRRHRRNKYEDYEDDDEQEEMNPRKRKKNRYDDDFDDEDIINQRKRKKNRYEDDSDGEEPIINQRKKKNYHNYESDDDDDEMYNPHVKKRQPAPEFNDDDRSTRNKARLKDQTVKRRVKESNPQLDGTFPDPYYKRKNVPITKI